jgi:hypothetical protein
MKCPSCQAENPDDAAECASCKGPLKRRPRRRRAEADEPPPTPEGEAFFRRARWVYFWALWSMVPLVGVVLGPLSALLAWWVGRERRPEWPGGPTLAVSLCLGLLSGVTQVVGVWLIAANWP